MLGVLVDHVIGVDSDRDRITVAVVCAKTQGELLTKIYPAAGRGYRAARRWAGGYSSPSRRAWAIKSSGSFGVGLATSLAESEEFIIEFDRPAKWATKDGAKSDTLDAVRAAKESLGRSSWSPHAPAVPAKCCAR